MERLLLPFKGLDIAEVYDSYSSIIDFILYAVLFVDISEAAFGKRFDSRGGRAVVSAVGLALAMGLALSEATLGFNLRSLGPLAAGIFIFLVGFMLFFIQRCKRDRKKNTYNRQE